MFYDLFCELCKKRGVSPTKATVEIGLSRTIGTKWKTTGATPQGETLSKIADYFGVSVDYLLGNEPKAKTPAETGERTVSDEDIMFALWGDTDDVDEDDLDDVKRYAAFVRERKNKK